MTFANIESLSQQLTALGASRIFCKALAENDNTKQQIYLGGSFEVIKLLPHHDVKWVFRTIVTADSGRT